MAKGSALTRKLPLSEDLADFMGKSTASRAEVTKALWVHIKKYELQSDKDKRIIIPDDTLAPLIGKKPINMLKMTGVISKHIDQE